VRENIEPGESEPRQTPTLLRLAYDFTKPAPGKFGIAGGYDLRERFVVVNRCSTDENSRPTNARTFASCVFDLGPDDAEAVALERRVKLGRRHLRLTAEDRDNSFHVNGYSAVTLASERPAAALLCHRDRPDHRWVKTWLTRL
jgi:hypothetical protein